MVRILDQLTLENEFFLSKPIELSLFSSFSEYLTPFSVELRAQINNINHTRHATRRNILIHRRGGNERCTL